MDIDGTVALLYAQTSLSAPIAHSTAVAPYAANATNAALAREKAAEEKQQVQKPEKAGDTHVHMREDGRGRGSFSQNRKRDRDESEGDEEADATVEAELGNILNIRV